MNNNKTSEKDNKHGDTGGDFKKSTSSLKSKCKGSENGVSVL